MVLNDRVKQVSGTLIIKEAKVEDSGKYLCVVNNSVGGKLMYTLIWMFNVNMIISLIIIETLKVNRWKLF